MDSDFAERDVNVGFSGGEEAPGSPADGAPSSPPFAVLDVDSDAVDALRIVSRASTARPDHAPPHPAPQAQPRSRLRRQVVAAQGGPEEAGRRARERHDRYLGHDHRIFSFTATPSSRRFDPSGHLLGRGGLPRRICDLTLVVIDARRTSTVVATARFTRGTHLLIESARGPGLVGRCA